MSLLIKRFVLDMVEKSGPVGLDKRQLLTDRIMPNPIHARKAETKGSESCKPPFPALQAFMVVFAIFVVVLFFSLVVVVIVAEVFVAVVVAHCFHVLW